MVTVFTPTYNRAYILPTLYDSLLRQTDKRFEWVIVDDGSNDGTDVLIGKWKLDNLFPIKYIKVKNGGKHRAINRGVKEANGILFFMVDSDDYLTDNAIELIIIHYNQIKNNPRFAGVSGIRCFPNGERIGGKSNFGILDCSSIDFRYKYNIKGDMGEVILTEIMRKFPFPEIEGEKFCPEAVLFNRIAQKYIIRYFYECVYICEYLPDGLSAKITKIRMLSPNASMLCYSELSRCHMPFKSKVKAIINYWRFFFCGDSNIKVCSKKIPAWGIVLIPFGLMMHLRDRIVV